jgi:hypothetical protein
LRLLRLDYAGHGGGNGDDKDKLLQTASSQVNGPFGCAAGPAKSSHSAARLLQQAAGSFIPARDFFGEGERLAMEELNGRMLACQILITGLIARVANDQRDPLRFLSDFRDEIKAVVNGINIAGMDNTERVRQVASRSVDELFSLMKPPSSE